MANKTNSGSTLRPPPNRQSRRRRFAFSSFQPTVALPMVRTHTTTLLLSPTHQLLHHALLKEAPKLQLVQSLTQTSAHRAARTLERFAIPPATLQQSSPTPTPLLVLQPPALLTPSLPPRNSSKLSLQRLETKSHVLHNKLRTRVFVKGRLTL